jgi:hypothetical protein
LVEKAIKIELMVWLKKCMGKERGGLDVIKRHVPDHGRL